MYRNTLVFTFLILALSMLAACSNNNTDETVSKAETMAVSTDAVGKTAVDVQTAEQIIQQQTTTPTTEQRPTTITPTTATSTEPSTTSATVTEVGYWELTGYKGESGTLSSYQIMELDKQYGTKSFIVFEEGNSGFMNLFGEETEFTWENGDLEGVKYTYDSKTLTITTDNASVTFTRSNEIVPKRGEYATAKIDPSTAQIEETVIYDAKGIKVTARSIDYGGWYGPSIKLLIENNSGQDLTFQVRDSSINGFMMDAMMSVDVRNGKKANDTMMFSDNDLEIAAIEGIAEIQFKLHIFNSSTWNDYTTTETITLKTNIYDTYEQVNDFKGVVIYDGNNIRILCLGINSGSFFGPELTIYIENNSSQDVTVQVNSCSINDFMIGTICSSEICAGKKILDTITLGQNDLDSSDIKFADISEVEISLNIFDSNTWRDIVRGTEPAKIKFRDK